MRNSEQIKAMTKRTFLCFLLAAIMVLSMVACKPTENEEWSYTRDPSLTDFATQVSLNESNLESDFNETGRGYVTVESFIDGDTVHFMNYSKTEKLKVRFIAIDTPESTGQIQPWGKPASIFTKTKLSKATKIVLEANEEGRPVFDSTGSRYLAWVWYKTSEDSPWRNLNIEILQEGLAIGKNSSSNRYGSTALAALSDARKNHLNLYSGQKDPLFYYGETVELSIKALVTNKEAYAGLKVRFEGVVTKESGQAVYVEAYDEDTQQSYGVYVYAGYAALADRFLKPGNKLRISGTADNNETYGFQISGLSFSLIDPRADDVQILEKGLEVHPTPVTASDINNNETLENTFVSISNLRVERIYTTTDPSSSSVGAMTLTCKTAEGETVTVRTSVLQFENGELVTESFFDRTVINVCGMIEQYEGRMQLKLLSLSDVTLIN